MVDWNWFETETCHNCCEKEKGKRLNRLGLVVPGGPPDSQAQVSRAKNVPIVCVLAHAPA